MRKLDGINRLVLRMDMLIIIRGILGLCFIVRVYPPPPLLFPIPTFLGGFESRLLMYDVYIVYMW